MQQKGVLVERRLRWRFADIVAQLVDVERETLAHHGLSAEQRRRLVYWVGKHVREDLQVIDLANELSMSGVTFRRRFQQTFGVTPRKWLAEERLRIIGRQLLNSTKSVQEIAAMFGYHSLSSFLEPSMLILAVAPSNGNPRAIELPTMVRQRWKF